MDAIDNLIYATRNTSLYPSGVSSSNIQSDFLIGGTNVLDESEPVGAPNRLLNLYPTQTLNGISSYSIQSKERFITFDDTDIVEAAIKKHWYDIANRVAYTNQIAMVPPAGFVAPGQANVPGSANRVFVDFNIPPYHLIFAYLVENTRISQIFEKLIWMYQHDEKLLKANQNAFRWIQNTESLFFSDRSATKSVTSFLRPVSEAVRRNAYQRMFGMDLAFGDLTDKNSQYIKAEFNNSSFITLFESFLIEVWQGYINANNTSGMNSTDVLHIEDIVRKLQEMLMLRRTSTLSFVDYQYFNLSREEYSSFIWMYWLFNIVSYNSSVVQFLNCDANTPGERIINIGKKVGLPAHTKSEALLDIAQPMNALLRLIETGLLNNGNQIERILRSRTTVNPNNPQTTTQEIAIMDNLLLILNNWEKATGHRIKNPQANITGSVKIQQNGVKMQPVMN